MEKFMEKSEPSLSAKLPRFASPQVTTRPSPIKTARAPELVHTLWTSRKCGNSPLELPGQMNHGDELYQNPKVAKQYKTSTESIEAPSKF